MRRVTSSDLMLLTAAFNTDAAVGANQFSTAGVFLITKVLNKNDFRFTVVRIFFYLIKT